MGLIHKMGSLLIRSQRLGAEAAKDAEQHTILPVALGRNPP